VKTTSFPTITFLQQSKMMASSPPAPLLIHDVTDNLYSPAHCGR